MWLGGQTEFPKCRGGDGVYDVLTFQKSSGGKSSPRRSKGPLNETRLDLMLSKLIFSP